jgi:lysophospholipase L1-like esterase
LLACGGWSRRRTLYGGDQTKVGEDPQLNPATEPARIRAFFVHPAAARHGLGRQLLTHCEAEAHAAGFRSLELMATLPGEPFYQKAGYRRVEDVEHRLPGGESARFVRMRRDLPPSPSGRATTLTSDHRIRSDRIQVPRRFDRYVAIGDSSTEGLDDPDGSGGFRGWADRLAERLSAAQGSLLYANLGLRGRRTPQIRAEQVDRALAMLPDLVTLFSGTNDVVARHFDVDAVAVEIERMQRTLVQGGAVVLTFTLPDITPVMPLARSIAPRIRALNEALRTVSAGTGAILVDFAVHSVASDPRLWSEDRLHANGSGHARIAAALAHALELPGTDDTWTQPLPPAGPISSGERLLAELSWARRYLAPWLWRHLRGRSSGDGRVPKRPHLKPV